MDSYATPDDLAAWIAADIPANTTSLLRSATFVVAKACNRDPYTDVPTDADAPILQDATCAQTATWLALGVDPAAAGTDVKVVTESKIGTGDVKIDAPTAADVTEVATSLSPEAEAILQSGGLLWLPVPLGADRFDRLKHYGLDDWHRWPFSLQEAEQIDAL